MIQYFCTLVLCILAAILIFVIFYHNSRDAYYDKSESDREIIHS